MSILLVALGAAVLTLAACGDSSAEPVATTAGGGVAGTEPSTTSTTTEAAGTTAPADAPRAKDGDQVKVHYTGALEDGEVFDSSEGREPLEFVVASGQVITGFDDAVRGLAVGETRTQRVEPVDGYGETDPNAVIEYPLADLPEGVVAGDQLSSATGATAVVLSIDEAAGTAQIDTNHSLAGKVLIFDVELIEIVPGG
jgi:FKBP-type peptidyl-prolyl cis-trans isomerase 2